MAGVLDRIRRAARPPFHTLSPTDARAAYEAAAEVLDLPRAPLPRVQHLQLPGGDGLPRPARLYAAGDETKAWLTLTACAPPVCPCNWNWCVA